MKVYDTTLLKRSFEKMVFLVDFGNVDVTINGEEYEVGYRVRIDIGCRSYHFNGFNNKNIFDTLREALIELKGVDGYDFIKQLINLLRRELK